MAPLAVFIRACWAISTRASSTNKASSTKASLTRKKGAVMTENLTGSFYRTVTLAMTGASGAQYGLRLLECLLAADCQVYLMISNAARIVISTETDLELPDSRLEQQRLLARSYNAEDGQLLLLDSKDWFSPVASGSSSPSSMVICPASGGTLSAIATGASNNLI